MLSKVVSMFLPSTSTTRQQDGTESGRTSITESERLESMKPRTLDQMLRYRAHLTPEAALLWYPSSDTKYVAYTAAQINDRVQGAALLYSKQIAPRTSSQETPQAIALLGAADLDYVITMFALYRLGHTVVTLSPRLAREGHDHLLDELDVHYIIYHESQSGMANILGESKQDLQICPLVQTKDDMEAIEGGDRDLPDVSRLDMDVEEKNLAVVIHSSGSTGLPKPTKLSHETLLMAANKNMDMKAFSCVPFFHAFGLNGLHRGIYACREFFFYNASVPLTAKHLIDTIEGYDFEIFFCVPYALKLLAETEAGINALQKCKLVWFAGSACPDDLGDALTERGIRLISDYGLSECGPLMTTMRPSDDHAWNYLRPLPHNKPYMVFEERPEDLYELVCQDGMPWKVASNRDDGSYATNDLFAKHATIENAYRFVARQDDTMVLSNGEKVNPSILEGRIRQHVLVTEAVMFGTGQSELGMMLIKSDAAKTMTDEQMLDRVWPDIENAQKEMPEHAQIVKSMLVALPVGTEYPRTDKGTIIRKQFYQKFAQEIEDAYTEENDTEKLDLNESELQNFIHDQIANTLGLQSSEELDIDTDLFGLGVDSLQSTQLRRILQARLQLKGQKLPFNVVYENPSVRQLSQVVYSMLQGGSDSTQDSVEKFAELVQKFGSFSSTNADSNRRCAVLTGATGSLGAHLLAQLLQDDTVWKVYCFVRASSADTAYDRVKQSLRTRKLYCGLNESEKAKIAAFATNLATPRLGLDPEIYEQVSGEVTTVIHAAWPVNFNMSLASFESDIAGTKNLLDLCLGTSASFSFCSSISTSLDVPEDETIRESVPVDISPALHMGYAQSKLVAETLCQRAAEQSNVRSYVMRIGQIVGDTENGIWNTAEAVPMMLETAQTINALPKMEEVHRWLPVDVVAKTILDTALPAAAPGGTVLNIVNPVGFRWASDLLPMLRKAGLEFEEKFISEWLEKLRQSDQDGKKNPPVKLLPYFESTYEAEAGKGRGEDHVWETQNASRYSPTFAAGWSLGESFVHKLVQYFQHDGWNHASGTGRDSQASWSSEQTLGDETKSQSDDGTRDKPSIVWNDRQKEFDLVNVNIKATQTESEQDSDTQSHHAGVDTEALRSEKTIAWSGTEFEVHEAAHTTSDWDDASTQESSHQRPSDTGTSEDAVMLPRDGEVVWDAHTGRFEVGSYGEETDAQAENINRTLDKQPEVELEAIAQPKDVVWDGTNFACREHLPHENQETRIK